MASIKGTQTEKNLLKSFAGESQARNRYWYYASTAKKEGYEQISALFLETAENEKEHAKVFYKYLEGGDLEITASYPAGMIGTTADNLLHAAQGEKMEWEDLYPEFARIADDEGFADVAESYRRIADAEAWHERRYRKLLENIDNRMVFARETLVRWKCRNCGYVHEGPAAPDSCPACRHGQAYFELWTEPY